MITLIRLLKRAFRSFCPLLLCAIFLSLWGCLAIYNASLQFEQPEYYVIRQCTWLVAGILVALFLYRVSATKIFSLIPWLYSFGLLSLFLVLIIGHSRHSMRGWFHTEWFSLQPSEFFKPIFCLFLCWYSDRLKNEDMSNLKKYLKLSLMASPGIILIALQPDFGTTLIFCILLVTIYWVYEGYFKYLFFSFIALIPFLALVLVKYPYVMDRFTGFWNPEAHAEKAGFHLMQLERSLASGGLWGRSFGHGLWSQGYLPLTHNDSIFASFCEATGFVGGLALIFVFSLALMAVVKKSSRMRNELYGKTLFMLVFSLCMQAFIHISVNIQLLPPTGITLPFFSYGGSSLMASFLIVGLCKSLIRTEKREMSLLEGSKSCEVEPFKKDLDIGKTISFKEVEVSRKAIGN